VEVGLVVIAVVVVLVVLVPVQVVALGGVSAVGLLHQLFEMVSKLVVVLVWNEYLKMEVLQVAKHCQYQVVKHHRYQVAKHHWCQVAKQHQYQVEKQNQVAWLVRLVVQLW